MPEPEEKRWQLGENAGGRAPRGGLLPPQLSSPTSSISERNLAWLMPSWFAPTLESPGRKIGACLTGTSSRTVPWVYLFWLSFLLGKPEAEGRAALLPVSGLGRKIASRFTPFPHYANAHLLNASFPSRIPAGPFS